MKSPTAEFFAERRARADVEEARRILFRDGGQPPVPEDRLPESARRANAGRR